LNLLVTGLLGNQRLTRTGRTWFYFSTHFSHS
jgi:hypothetical protein